MQQFERKLSMVRYNSFVCSRKAMITDIVQNDKNQRKTDKTGHENEKSSRNRSRRRIHLKYVVHTGRVIVPTGRYVVPAEHKDETYHILKDFINLVENQLNTKVKAIRCDNGTEFKNAHMIDFCGSKGIKREYSNPRTLHQNGFAERKNRTPIEAARTILDDSKLPTMFWTEAVRTACYVLNRVSVTSPHNKTPYALLTGNIPSISHFKPFGCHVTILNTNDHLGKFDEKADEGYIVGYSTSNKANMVYNVPNKRVEESMNLRFLEDKPNVQGTQGATTNSAGTQDADSDSDCDEQVIIFHSYPSLNIQQSEPKDTSGDKVDDSPIQSADKFFQKELAKLKDQEQRVSSDAESLGLGFANNAEELQTPTSAKTFPPGCIPVPIGKVPVPTGRLPVPTGSIPIPAAATKPTTRFSCPSDLGNHASSPGIFSSSSYDDEFGVALNNVASTVEVSPVATKRINTIHPRSLIIGDPTSAVQTRSKVKQTSTGDSAFISYIFDQQRDNHTDYQHCLFACFLSQVEPRSVAQTLEDLSWVDAMQEEMQQFKFQNVWVLIDLPAGKYAIGTKWILKNKRYARGIVVRNKARLVAQGHRQEEGINYDEVFAPVARIKAIRLFLAFASYMRFLVYQMDVKSAFLYGRIDEKVYVTQPKGFVDPQHPKKVYKVDKALYGLHQAPRAWYATLSAFLLKHGYRRGNIDKTIFLKKNNRDIIMVQVYVDDIIFGSTKKAWRDEFEALMKGEFQMSAMGELTFFLGLQVQQRPDGIFIHQDKYVQEILNKFDLGSVRTTTTPYEATKPKSKNESDSPVNIHLYRSMIGSLMYLTASRPDIIFAVSACLRHQVTPTTFNLEAVKNIFKYLKDQPINSDYVGANNDRKSTTGGCQFLGRRLISWQCKKQTIMATSSTEAKYVVAANCCGQPNGSRRASVPFGVASVPTGSFVPTGCSLPTGFIDFPSVPTLHSDHQPAQTLNPISTSSVATLRYKDEHNKMGYLLKPTGSDDYHQIIDFLRPSHIRYALTHDPIIFDSLVKQFWFTATLKASKLGPPAILATIYKTPYTITEDLVMSRLQLADDGGIADLPIAEIYSRMDNLGYVTEGRLTFYKNKFSPQWRFLVHTLLHRLSTNSGSWDQFGNPIAVALICLSDGRHFNWSSYIFRGMVSNIGNAKKFLMYPRFLQTILGIETRVTIQNKVLVLSGKLFANMRLNFTGHPMPLLPAMLLQAQAGEGAEVAAQAVPQPVPAPDQPPASLSTPSRQETSDPIALVLEHGQSSDPHTDSFSRSHETDAGPFITVEDALSTLVQTIHSLESKLKDHKKLFKNVVGKLVKKVKALEVKLKTKKRKMAVSDSDQEDGGTQDMDLDALHALANAAVHVDSNIPSGGTSHIPAASPSVSTAVPPGTSNVSLGTSDVPPGNFDVPLGTFAVPSGASTAPAGSPHVPTNVPSSAAPAGVSSKGKSPMVKEDIPVKARTLKQMKEDRLSEEAAKQLHDEEVAQMERQRAEMQRKRQQDVLDSAMYYNEADWLTIRAQVEANASLSKTLLGDDVSEDNFLARMAALITRKRQVLAEQLFKESTIYNTGWTMAYVKSFTDDQLKQEFEKIRKVQSNSQIQAFSRTLKRPGPVLEEPSSKRQQSTEASSPSVPEVTHSPAVSSPPSSHTKRKSLGRKHIHKPKSTLPKLDLDAPAQTFIKVVVNEDSDDEVWSAVVGWEVIPTPLGEINALYRIDENHPVVGAGLLFWGDIQVLFDSQAEERVLSMFTDVSYPLSVKLMERMLMHKLELDSDVVGNDMTTAEQLIQFIKNQLATPQASSV
uniref:Putative ribonuclease H-like domain-containing protein n=1 Tax=Tanacetum cinerariifolium TaxID=118510 RepID=A0A6L2JJN3_TANCI|nr:putative ribonuclease H-like domain-containing protein [Tanacetum cinerariifolium]